MDKHSKEILDLFCEKGKTIPGLYDLVLRGSASKKNQIKAFVKDWSDLDLSIIVERITKDVRDKVRDIYQELKKHTDMKITIILVDTEDFFRKFHYHGAKDLHYSHAFPYFESLHRRDISYGNRNAHNLEIYQLSSYMYISFLIHDLRKQYFSCGNSIIDIREFFYNLVKRANIIAWNALFFKTAHEGPDTDYEKIYAEYPNLDKDFSHKLQYIRENWAELRYKIHDMSMLTDYLLNNIEYLYSEIHKVAADKY